MEHFFLFDFVSQAADRPTLYLLNNNMYYVLNWVADCVDLPVYNEISL